VNGPVIPPVSDPVTGAAIPAGRPGGPRPHFTGRAAILAVVFCAIALSLAYPVREYIAQRRQIDQLQAQRSQTALQLKRLEQERKRLKQPAYIEQQARDRLHMCFPGQTCYVIIDSRPGRGKGPAAGRDEVPWYARLWSSVRQANEQPPARLGPAGSGRRASAPDRTRRG
jgi:cell division protein FtsB